MIKYVVAGSLVIVTVAVLFINRNGKNKMRYAIQHLKTGKNIRPYKAGKQDGNRIILYDHHSWKCMTWDFIKLDAQTFQLQNRYTGKSFEIQGEPAINVKLYQRPFNNVTDPGWEFIRQPGETYLIKVKDKDLYLSISSDATNSDIILLPLQNSEDQFWRLIEQNPLF